MNILRPFDVVPILISVDCDHKSLCNFHSAVEQIPVIVFGLIALGFKTYMILARLERVKIIRPPRVYSSDLIVR